MSIGTLTGLHGQAQTKVILAVAAYSGLQLDLSPDYKHSEDNKKPEFLAKFPHGKIPVFEDKEGFSLYEGAAIARYVAALKPESGLLGSNLKEASLVDQYTHLIESEIGDNTIMIWGLVSGKGGPYNKDIHATLTKHETKPYVTLNNHLATNTYLLGDKLTLADLHLAAALQRSVKVTLGKAEREKYPHLIKHLEHIVNLPKVKEVFGPIEYVEHPAQYAA